MKKMYLLAVLMAAAMPFTSMAQDDDLYFNPKKEAKEKAERKAALLREYKAQQARRDSIYALFWSGSNRNVDEYNRGGRFLSHYEKVGTDSLGNDIIQFHVGKGVAPDSIYDDAYFAQKYINEEEDFGNTRRYESLGWLLRSLVLWLLWLWSILLALPHVGLAQSLAIRLLYGLVRPMV